VKSFRPKDGSGDPPGPGRNRERDFHGERRKNATHVSTTDPDARLFRKGPGKEARLVFIGHALMENRNGLVVGAVATRASGHAERLAALALIEPHGERPRVTLGADKGYDSADFVVELREQTVTPHVAQNQSGRRSAIDGRTTRHPGYAISHPHPHTHRGGLWLRQDGGRFAQDAASRAAQDRLAIHPGNGRLRSCAIAQNAGRGGAVTAAFGNHSCNFTNSDQRSLAIVVNPAAARVRSGHRRRPHRFKCSDLSRFQKPARACRQLSQMIAAARWMAARKFRAVLS
jgi:hypothetical protein